MIYACKSDARTQSENGPLTKSITVEVSKTNAHGAKAIAQQLISQDS